MRAVLRVRVARFLQNGYPVTILVRLGVAELSLCLNRPYHRRLFLIEFGDGMPDLPVVVIWFHGGYVMVRHDPVQYFAGRQIAKTRPMDVRPISRGAADDSGGGGTVAR